MLSSRRVLPLAIVALLLAPATSAVVPQNDAGLGSDAPGTPNPSFRVATNSVHEGLFDLVLDSDDVYAFDGTAGDQVSLAARGSTGCFYLITPALVESEALGCSYGEATTLSDPPVTLDATGTWYARFTSLAPAAYRFVIAQNAAAPDLSLAAGVIGSEPTLVAGSDPTCGTGIAVTATEGAGDAALPTLAYAALKTGHRAVVAWETSNAFAATLTASVNGGPSATFTEPLARNQHVFILDGLPEGATFCFTPENGSPHAMRLANAMNARIGGVYTVNLLVLGNEQPDRAAVEGALDRFAETFWDATDGHVAAGRIITLFGDYERHNSGWTSCYLPSILTGPTPFCQNVYDVLFTYDGSAGGAAQTYADAIRDPAQAIWMDQEFQAGLVTIPDDPGRVLMHEMGHYAFGAMDLYGALTGTDPDCWDAAKGLSVMGGNRAATEFDDEVNRCPNEAGIAGYVPTWTLLREDFPAIPERSVINAGPAGDGGRYARHSFVITPQISDEVAFDTDVQNDAGSGHDAGGSINDALPITPGVAYSATGLGPAPDLLDVYSFTGRAGDTFRGSSIGNLGCYTLLDSDGASLGNECSYGLAPIINGGPLTLTLPADGIYYFEIAQLMPAYYEFGISLNGPAPSIDGIPLT